MTRRKQQDPALRWPGVGTPNYFAKLTEATHDARELLWLRIQAGHFASEKEAEQCHRAYRAAVTADDITQGQLTQLKLPDEEPESDDQAPLDPDE